MKFSSAASVEQCCHTFRMADWPRAQNRVLINTLFNGEPPETPEEQDLNNHGTNYNDLSASKINHDARSQFDNAFLAPDPLFTVNLDYGPSYKRIEWSGRITKEINKRILASPKYLELRQGIFASVVLHGIGPAVWEDKELWCPRELGIEDVLVPSNTLRSMENLPFFAEWRSYTAPELYRITHGPRVDPAWNMPLVEQCLDWVDRQCAQLVGQNYPSVWSPEKMSERFKQDSGAYASDAVPTIDTFHFYFWNDENKVSGWNRRVILDAWGLPGTGGVAGYDPKAGASVGNRRFKHGKGEFLYDSGNRKYADKLDRIIHFQFGDASAVAPFRYHSVRSLGFLLYSVCSLQNLTKSRFSDATFEAMLQYFRVANPADMDRLSKIDLTDKGVLPEGLQFVPLADRWQVPEAMVLQAMQINRQAMSDVSSAFTQDLDLGEKRDADETATRTMAKVNASAALVGSMLNRAYARQRFQYIEICRRFCIANSKDPDVKKFRVECLKHGVPEEALNVEAWDIQPTRVTGGGNKLLQVAIADKMQAIRPQLDPDAQKEVDRIYIAANTNDWNLAKQLVPEIKHVSSSMVQAGANVGTLMAGIKVPFQQGINHTEYVETMLTSMAMKVQEIETMRGGMATADQILGLQTMAEHIKQHIQVIAGDKNEKGRVKQYGDWLGNLENNVKAYGERLQEQAQSQNGNGQPDPEKLAKIQLDVMQSQAKIEQGAKSHAQKTAQRQVQFEQKLKQDAAQDQLRIQQEMQQHSAELAKTTIETAHAVEMNKLKSPPEGETKT